MFNVSRSQFLTDLTWSLNFLDIRFCACTHSPTSLGFGKVPYSEVYSDEDLNWNTKIHVPTIFFSLITSLWGHSQSFFLI